MKIAKIETLRGDGGHRVFSYLKITTDEGLVGWSEFQESWGAAGLNEVVLALSPGLIGRDPLRIEVIVAVLKAATVQSRGGLNRQAIGAYENALLDIKGKALGVPVWQLLGGALRDRIPVYWSHCGSYRVGPRAALMGVKQCESYDDLSRLGEEVVSKGFTALKTNVLPMENGKLVTYRPGAGGSKGFPELNYDRRLVNAAVDSVMAFRRAVGPDVSVMLDLNFNFKTEGFRRIADALAPAELFWLEIDSHDPASLALIRRDAPCPIASCEALYERRDFRPFLDAYAMDVPIIDVMFNGYLESLKIASMCDTYDLNVAPHNFYSHLSSYIAAHFCAAVPNFRIMEIDIDGVPQRDEFVTPPTIEKGEFVLPTAPGWGVEVNEAAVRARPPKS